MKMLNSVRLTDNQKRVIAKIVAAPTPKVAAEEISKGTNLIGARDALIDLQLVQSSLNDQVELTDKGRQVAQEENIVDDAGQLTPDGEQYAYTDEFGKEDTDQQQAPGSTDAVNGDPMGMPPPAEGDPLMMSYSEPLRMPLLRELLNL